MKSFRLVERAERNNSGAAIVVWGVLASTCLTAFFRHWYVAGVLIIIFATPRAALLLSGSTTLSNNETFRQLSTAGYIFAVTTGVCVLGAKIFQSIQ